MTDAPIDYVKLEQQRNHDNAVRDRRNNGWQLIGFGLLLLGGNAVSLVLFNTIFPYAILGGLALIPIGVVRRLTAGKLYSRD
jgi:hypothetical protein